MISLQNKLQKFIPYVRHVHVQSVANLQQGSFTRFVRRVVVPLINYLSPIIQEMNQLPMIHMKQYFQSRCDEKFR